MHLLFKSLIECYTTASTCYCKTTRASVCKYMHPVLICMHMYAIYMHVLTNTGSAWLFCSNTFKLAGLNTCMAEYCVLCLIVV